jgi:hypothetical protein
VQKTSRHQAMPPMHRECVSSTKPYTQCASREIATASRRTRFDMRRCPVAGETTNIAPSQSIVPRTIPRPAQ